MEAQAPATTPTEVKCNPYTATIVITSKQHGDPADPSTDWYFELPEFGIKDESYFRTEAEATAYAEQVRGILSWYGETYANHCFPR